MKPYLFIGLGNVGVDYVNTRHNIGFDVVDELADQFGCIFSQDKLAFTTDFRYKARTIYMIKPTTYMNLSGRAFRYYMQQYNVPVNNTLTIVDDIALNFGQLRVKGHGSAAGHNGLKNIEQEMGTQAYARLRFGIGNDFPRGKQVDYVLGNWSAKESEELAYFINQASKACLSFVAHGLQNTMNEFNQSL